MSEQIVMKASKLFIALALLFLAVELYAADAPAPTPYSGDIWNRSTLTGDWGGLRNELAAKGVTLDMSITQVGQGVVGGGKNGAWEYGGRGDLILNLDSGKLGLWPGGFFNFEMEGNWASAVNSKTGALMPVNSNQVYPLPPGDIFGVPAWNFTQFLSPYFGLTIGKFATITANSGDMNEFAHGKGDTQFMNLALNFNPVLAFTVPYSTLGTGLVVLPTKDPKEAIASFLVMSANGNPTTSGFENLNGNAIVIAAEGRLRTDFFGRTGHQLFGTTFSNKNFTSMDQRLRSIIETNAFRSEKGSWNIYYNFDQYLYEAEKGVDRGIGVFGRLGVSDGNPDLMKFFGSFGVGGKGLFESRPHDQFGWGFYYINIDNPRLDIDAPRLRDLGLPRDVAFLRDEYGFEAYYNFAITPWALLTPDIQVVRGAQKDQFSISRGPLGILPRINKKSISTSTVLGLRLQLVF
jgi:porin